MITFNGNGVSWWCHCSFTPRDLQTHGGQVAEERLFEFRLWRLRSWEEGSGSNLLGKNAVCFALSIEPYLFWGSLRVRIRLPYLCGQKQTCETKNLPILLGGRRFFIQRNLSSKIPHLGHGCRGSFWMDFSDSSIASTFNVFLPSVLPLQTNYDINLANPGISVWNGTSKREIPSNTSGYGPPSATWLLGGRVAINSLARCSNIAMMYPYSFTPLTSPFACLPISPTKSL